MIANIGRLKMRAILVGVMAIVSILYVKVAESASDGTISNPKEWCEQLLQTAADKDNEKMLSMIIAGGLRTIAKEDAAQGLSGIPPLLVRMGDFRRTAHLAERYYGETLARFWYTVLFTNGTLFARCELIKISERWALLTVDFRTESAQINLP
jgi:hypothetical protein